MVFPAAVQALDEVILRSARGAPNWAVPVFYVLTMFGNGWPLVFLVPLLFRARTRSFALWLALSVGVTVLCVDLVKIIVARVRPCDALPWASAIRVPSPGGYSFPSGHAAGSFAFAGFVFVWASGIPSRRWAYLCSAFALVYATLVAWSRCVLAVHYPSDVLAGAVLGASVGAWFATMERKRRAPLATIVEAAAEEIGEAKHAVEEKLGEVTSNDD